MRLLTGHEKLRQESLVYWNNWLKTIIVVHLEVTAAISTLTSSTAIHNLVIDLPWVSYAHIYLYQSQLNTQRPPSPHLPKLLSRLWASQKKKSQNIEKEKFLSLDTAVHITCQSHRRCLRDFNFLSVLTVPADINERIFWSTRLKDFTIILVALHQLGHILK